MDILNLLSSLEERRPVSVGPARVIDIPCSYCGQRLIEIRFVNRFVHVCDNWECTLYRQSQGNREKMLSPKKKLTPGRQRWLVKRDAIRNARYHLACSLGIGSYRAYKLRDQTTIDIRSFAKHD
ncbi:MAG: hypothetical protein MUO61_03425 [Dehalococcoidia bacterium]|nr:hypothetical protein [Dehalococcoidia bacterium]